MLGTEFWLCQSHLFRLIVTLIHLVSQREFQSGNHHQLLVLFQRILSQDSGHRYAAFRVNPASDGDLKAVAS